MKEKNIIAFLIVSIILLSGVFISLIGERFPLKKNEILICNTNSLKGYKIIDRSKIISYKRSTGYWIFTNGYAKNCYKEKINIID